MKKIVLLFLCTIALYGCDSVFASESFSTGYIASGQHTCAISTGGTLSCWGTNTYGQATATGGIFDEYAAARTASCGIKSDGSLACWGNNDQGQSSPPAGDFYTKISGSNQYFMGLTSTGKVIKWGAGAGDGTFTGTYNLVSAGYQHACAIRSSDSSIECSGANTYGESTPTAGTGFLQVSSGMSYSCAIKSDGSLTCWGRDNYLQITNKPAGTGFKAVAAGDYSACAIKSDDTVQCWGRNLYGEITPPNYTFKYISSGVYFSCGIKLTDGNLACWGINTSGQITFPAGVYGDYTLPESTGSTVACTYTAYDIDTQVFSGMTCWGESLGNVSYTSIIAVPTDTFLGMVSNKAILGNCTYANWDIGSQTIDSMDCPSYALIGGTTGGSTPEDWGVYLEGHLFQGIGFLLICLFAYFLIILSLGFGLKYGFYFFDSPTNGTKK